MSLWESARRLNRLVRRAIENRLVLALEDRMFEALAQGAFRAARRAPIEQPRQHLLVPPTGQGSIGDAAMLEAYIENVPGEICLLARNSQSRIAAGRVHTVEFPALIYGTPIGVVLAARRFGRLLASARSLSVVGADVMDGAYRESASVRRFRVVRIAGELGVDARVLGFSWNQRPTRNSVRAMLRASRVATLCARDPVSARRLLADGATSVHEAADLALLVQPRRVADEPLAQWLSHQHDSGRQVIVLCANSLLEGHSPQVAAFTAIIREHLPKSYSFLLFPHDGRGRPSDIDLAREIGQRFATHPNVYAQGTLLAPGEVASVCERSDLVVTGRLHLALLAASVGRPAVTISYQGKVEGLYERLGSDTFVMPGPQLEEALPEAFRTTLRRLSELEEVMANARPDLVRLAEANLTGLV